MIDQSINLLKLCAFSIIFLTLSCVKVKEERPLSLTADVVFEKTQDTKSMYSLTYKDLGNGPGQDDEYGTHDDDIINYKLIFQTPNETTTSYFESPGEDGIWLTKDDTPTKYIKQHKLNEINVVTNVSSAGKDRLWYTDDDPLITTLEGNPVIELDNLEITLSELGEDGLPKTVDDILTSYVKLDQNENRTTKINYNEPGLDGIWKTQDDIPVNYVVETFNDAGKHEDILKYNIGIDGIMHTSDDYLVNHKSFTYDKDGKPILIESTTFDEKFLQHFNFETNSIKNVFTFKYNFLEDDILQIITTRKEETASTRSIILANNNAYTDSILVETYRVDEAFDFSNIEVIFELIDFNEYRGSFGFLSNFDDIQVSPTIKITGILLDRKSLDPEESRYDEINNSLLFIFQVSGNRTDVTAESVSTVSTMTKYSALSTGKIDFSENNFNDDSPTYVSLENLDIKLSDEKIMENYYINEKKVISNTVVSPNIQKRVTREYSYWIEADDIINSRLQHKSTHVVVDKSLAQSSL